MVLRGLVWYGMAYGTAWHRMVWRGMAWYGMKDSSLWSLVMSEYQSLSTISPVPMAGINIDNLYQVPCIF